MQNAVAEIREDNIVYLRPVPPQPAVQNNKKKGVKSEVYAFSIDEMKKMLDYFAEREEWLHYMLFVISCNQARRNSDLRCLTWRHFFNPETGDFRKDLLPISEQKTDKFATPHINAAVRSAIMLYIEKTGCDPSKDDYNVPICLQLSGTHKGEVLSYDGCRKAIKRAAKALGIEQNVGTHSARKTFGAMSRMLHPNDYDSMEILQSIYNHSDSKTTRSYIGLTKEKVDGYYDDMGEFFESYITGDKECELDSSKSVISFDTAEFRELLMAAYEAGRNNANADDAMVHMQAFSELMARAEQAAK